MDVLEVVLLVKWIFVLYLDVEVPCRLLAGILRRLSSCSLSWWNLWRRRRCNCFFMLGDGVSCAVCGGLGTVMVYGVDSIICSAGGEVSFSGASRRTVCCTVGDDLVGGGRLAAVGWRGHSPAVGAGCLLLSALFL